MATPSPIRIMCPNLRCRAILAVPHEARGKLVRCKGCGTNILIPKKPATKSAPTSADPPGDSAAA